MISARRLPREVWEAELRFYGCKPQAGLGPLNTAEWWRMPWQSWPITFPVEPDGYMFQSVMDELLMKILSTAPEGTKFPYD